MSGGSWLVLGDVARIVTAPIAKLTTRGPIFLANGQPWRWKGVSAFPLMDLFEKGESIDPFLDAFAGFNLLRVWPYVPNPPWVPGWKMPARADTPRTFAAYVGARGFQVEFTLLLDDDPAMIPRARAFVEQLRGATNVVLEIGNEPTTNKRIDTLALKSACEASGFLYSSGDYEDSPRFFGTFGTAHTPRDPEWPRKAHDLMEYFQGGGPAAPSDPAHKVPWVGDEPIRPDQAGFNALDYRAHFGACSLFGAGATFHYEGGKFGRVPTADEARCAAAALAGLNAFPADAPLGAYSKRDDQTLRTYVIGTGMVRVRPRTLTAPEPGWTAIDTDGILWRR